MCLVDQGHVLYVNVMRNGLSSQALWCFKSCTVCVGLCKHVLQKVTKHKHGNNEQYCNFSNSVNVLVGSLIAYHCCLLLHVNLVWWSFASGCCGLPSRPIKQRNTHSLVAPQQRHVFLWSNLICC